MDAYARGLRPTAHAQVAAAKGTIRHHTHADASSRGLMRAQMRNCSHATLST